MSSFRTPHVVSLALLAGVAVACANGEPDDVAVFTNTSLGDETGGDDSATGSRVDDDEGEGTGDPGTQDPDGTSDGGEGTQGDEEHDTDEPDDDTAGPSGTMICPVFEDTFDAPQPSPQWQVSHGHQISVGSGEAIFNVSAPPGDEFVRMMLRPETETFEGATVRIQPGITPVGHGVQLGIWIEGFAQNEIAFWMVDRQGVVELEARIRLAGVYQSPVATSTFNPQQHRWLQVRESMGDLYFEVSSDGDTFTPFGQVATPFDLTNARAGFAASNWAPLVEDVTVSVQTFRLDCGVRSPG